MQRLQPQPPRSKEAQNNDANCFGRPWNATSLWRVISKNEPYSGLETFGMVFVTIKYTKKKSNSVRIR
jgi:hypothetical protein